MDTIPSPRAASPPTDSPAMPDSAILPLVFDVHAHHPANWGASASWRFCASGFSSESNDELLRLAPSFPNGVFSLGLGPQEIQQAEKYPDLEKAITQVEQQAEKAKENAALAPRFVAVGEVGLDKHWGTTPAHRERQFLAFERMIALASKLSLPLIIHSRDAEAECLRQLQAAAHLRAASPPPSVGAAPPAPLRVLMHCFGGNLEQAKSAVELGWLISIPPVPSKERKKIIAALPLTSLVIESDAPYIGKESGLGALQSAGMISRYKNIPLGEVLRQTALNAEKFFGL